MLDMETKENTQTESPWKLVMKNCVGSGSSWAKI